MWPDLSLVKAQRIVLWGVVIQAYLLHAPDIYTQLEAMRTDLSEEVAQAVASGAVPGCSGDTVEVILCMLPINPLPACPFEVAAATPWRLSCA